MNAGELNTTNVFVNVKVNVVIMSDEFDGFDLFFEVDNIKRDGGESVDHQEKKLPIQCTL